MSANHFQATGSLEAKLLQLDNDNLISCTITDEGMISSILNELADKNTQQDKDSNKDQ
jgi:DNA-binding TFAR19-related protein (PDSD5 family)